MRFTQEISIFNPYAIQDALVDMGTRITQTADEIRLEAAATYATQTGLQTLSSRISQTATAISFSLSKNGDRTAQLSMTYTKEDGSRIQLAAQSVEFTGLVRFTDLSTSGSTTINGNNITTGIIKDANSNTTFNLSTGALTIKKGSINLGSGAFSVTDAGILTMKKGSINLGNGTFTVSNAGRLVATDIYLNAPLGTTGSRVYAYDIGGTRLNMGDGSNNNATFFVNVSSDRVWTRNMRWIDRSGGLRGGIEIDGDSSGNPNFMRLRATHGLKIGSDGGENFLVGPQSTFKGFAVFEQGLDDGSDRRIKQNIVPMNIDDSVQFIMGLKPTKYEYKASPGLVRHGFIAQDVQEIIKDDWSIVRDHDGTLGLNYTDIIADLVATVQRQQEQIEALEGRQNG